MIAENPYAWDPCLSKRLSSQPGWSCVSNHASSRFGQNAWSCEGTGCQDWLDEAMCILMNGTPTSPPTSFTQWYADSVIYYNAVDRWLPKVGISFTGTGSGALNRARFFITMPISYLSDQDFGSAVFVQHVSTLVHEFWHAIQAFAGNSILREIEAFNVQSKMLLDLGVLDVSDKYIVALIPSQRRDMLSSLGLPTPISSGLSRDYCTLCRALSYLTSDTVGPGYEGLPLISEPIPVTQLVCQQYNCPSQ